MNPIKSLAGPLAVIALPALVYMAVSGDARSVAAKQAVEAEKAAELAAQQESQAAVAAAQGTPDLTNPKCRPVGYQLLQASWPDLNFKRCEINLKDVRSGGPPIDGIPAVGIEFAGTVTVTVEEPVDPDLYEEGEAPQQQFRPQQVDRIEVNYLPAEDIPAPPSEITDAEDGKPVQPPEDGPRFWLADNSPLIELDVNGDVRGFPLSVLTWHEITNARVGGELVTVTYCPLCNTAMVFNRKVGGKVLNFGVSGLLRHSDMIMYDAQTKSWWQQYEGLAIAGAMSGAQLEIMPSRIISFAEFKKLHGEEALVQVPTYDRMRTYGFNPYTSYDTSKRPFLFSGETPEGVEPMEYVVAIGGRAWTLDMVEKSGEIKTEDGYRITVAGGDNYIQPASALDNRVIANSRALSSVTVTKDGRKAPTKLTFAFAFFAFNPDGTLQTADGEVRFATSEGEESE
ncbi:MAG: hypothetical protein Alpg2KO_13480 [Alphaproteobacteria bacterium]